MRVLRTVPTVPVQLIRHGCAGDKRRWIGSDIERPLDETGVRQAEVLAGYFADLDCSRIVTSPALRCVQTIAPLAHRLAVQIEELEELSPDGDVAALGLLAATLDADRGVICTHGEVMRPLLAGFHAAGIKITSSRPDDDDWLLRKGTAWTLTIGPVGTIIGVDHQAPADLPPCPDHENSDS